ncbi:DNA polymerase alpha/epsilon subunit B-domain-containing protein [Glomus cerebriforme]|uniref:DNA polymerase alpha subunit B n=1 Tax=Glomus cerebriforme TaxID=658196 RepID=A0A397T2R1_9GLOM|nr:DNA polymerase alpha/epsilon subunit B-domain-containing protein [Glomus cerebriforme]
MQELTTNPQGGLMNSKTGEPIVYNKETIGDFLEKKGIQMDNQHMGKDIVNKFSDRKNKGKIEDTLNPHISTYDNSANTSKRCKIVLIPDKQVESYRYMYQPQILEELDDRFSSLSTILKNHYNLEVFDVFHINQDMIHTIGRICCDSEGKLNNESILLEIPEKRNRVKLSLNELESYSLFSGQIVGVNGINNTGNHLNINRIFEIPLLPMYKAPSSELIEYQKRLNEKPLNIVVAAGPFTFDVGFGYESFNELLIRMKQERPDLLILLGPFVSEDHPLLIEKKTFNTPGEIFKEYITDKLSRFIATSPGVSIVMVPSTKDLFHCSFVFPQSPFPKSGLPRDVICTSNPAQFRVNEITFVIDNVDILFHLASNEIERNAVPGLDRMSRLSRHILTQRHLYPLFPTSPEINLELKKSNYLELQNLPDILILPSKLKYFAKIVENVICINPGYLSKSESGGTYAKITIHPLQETLIKDDVTENLVSKRARVEIIRI